MSHYSPVKWQRLHHLTNPSGKGPPLALSKRKASGIGHVVACKASDAFGVAADILQGKPPSFLVAYEVSQTRKYRRTQPVEDFSMTLISTTGGHYLPEWNEAAPPSIVIPYKGLLLNGQKHSMIRLFYKALEIAKPDFRTGGATAYIDFRV